MKPVLHLIRMAALAAAFAWPAGLRSDPIAIGGHVVTFVGVEYDYPDARESTWYYTVQGKGPPAISHVVFGLGCPTIQILDAGTWNGADRYTLHSGGGTPEPNKFPAGPKTDPTTGVTGLKFDRGFNENETRHYYFTVNGNYAAGDIVFGIKAGQQKPLGLVPGPSHDCAVAETASISLVKTGEVIMPPVNCEVFGLAGAFNALIFGDFSAVGGDTEEPLAIGGTARFSGGYSVGTALYGNYIPTHYGDAVDMLIVGGDLYDGVFGVNGNIVYGGTRSGPLRTMENGNALRHVSPVTFDEHGNVPDDGSGVTFADLHAQLSAKSAQLGGLADRGVVTKARPSWYQIVLEGNDPVLNVFNFPMPPGGLSSCTIDLTAPPGSTVLINIHGEDILMQYSDFRLHGVTRNTVLFNFPEALQIVFRGLKLPGSLLAPYASALLSGGEVEGRAVLGGDVHTDTGFEFHNYPFTGEICLGDSDVDPYVVYRFAVMNTGAVALTNVTVADPLVTVMGGPIALAPGASDDTTFNGVYLLTPEDLAAGSVQNTAVASGTAPSGRTVTDSDTCVLTFEPPETGLRLNGALGLVSVSPSDRVSLSLSLDAGLYAGFDADWWLLALPHQGALWYGLGPDGAWMPVPAGRLDAFVPVYQGPLRSLRAPVPGLTGVRLSPGVYTLVFAVDPLDGLLNYPGGPILYETLTVTVR